ncbi:MAG: hypothetical protein M1411_05695 [Candidatus Thermoplasmatota archaeon]|nr:hypothetical protein [Candidatus Thermoplasmatota archaeon]
MKGHVAPNPTDLISDDTFVIHKERLLNNRFFLYLLKLIEIISTPLIYDR